MSPQSETRLETPSPTSEYSKDERELLLQLAHRAINSALEGRQIDLTPPSRHLAEMRGAFTTLHLNGKLRGCIGYVVPTHSLYRSVAETAQAAAFDDPRFLPVTAEEAPSLEIEISVLSPLRVIDPNDVVLGKHGLIISKGSR